MDRLRIFIRRLHLWLGLSVGVLFALLGLTGSTLVFYEDIDRWVHPEIRVVGLSPAPGWDSPVWDQALSTVRARWPDRAGAWRFEATGRPGPLPARYQPPQADHHGERVMVWLTPDGRGVLREATWGRYAVTWLYDLHMELLAGATGRAVVGWSGLAMVLLLLSGLWAWWPKGRWGQALLFKRPAVMSRRLRDVHKLTGLAGLALLLMLTVTGVMLALPDETQSVLSATVGPVQATPRPRQMPHADGDTRAHVALAAALNAAHRVMPEGRLAWVEAPARASGPARPSLPDGVIMVRVQQPGDPSFRFPHSRVWLDPYSGQVLAVQDRGQAPMSNRVLNWLHPLHDASVGGLTLRWLVALAGLLPALLCATGWWRWRLVRGARRVSGASARHAVESDASNTSNTSNTSL